MTRVQIKKMIANGWKVVNLRKCVPTAVPTRPIQVWMKTVR